MTARVQRERVKEILDLALERPTGERGAFVAGMCAGETALREEVLSLLGTLEGAGTMLEPEAPAAAALAEPLTGLRFGAYRVGERIGAGGMGVVYKAEDTRLGRTVAVKALPAHLAGDPHRRARFEQEARVLASLNHPNIAAIHGVDDTARGPVLVLEYVGGEPLSARLARGCLPLDEAVPIARQILRALEAAHAAGVVHRDLKPANIHVLPDGGVKVLDFGIAKLEPGPLVGTSPSTPGGSPVIVVTGPVGVLGTASYMSPEQARGKPVDRRTDIWAFGCVLYEMLTGRRAFAGETFSDTLAALLRAEPDWPGLPPGTPRHAASLLRACLAKDADRRLRDAGDARLQLDAPADDEPPAGATTGRPGGRLALAFGAGVLLAAIIALALWPRTGPRGATTPERTVRFSVRVPADSAATSLTAELMAISPDGADLVYAAGAEDARRLIKRSLDKPDWTELPGTTGATCPFFSPDGAWIGFVSGDQLKRVPVRGGGAEVLVPDGVGDSGCAWSDNGAIAFANRAHGLSLLDAVGAPARVLTVAEKGTGLSHPEFLNGGDAVLFTVCLPSDGFDGRIEAVRVSTGQRQLVYGAACCPRYIPDERAPSGPGRLMFWQSGSLLVAPFDPRTLRVTGSAVPIAPLPQAESTPLMRFAASRTRAVLATIPGNVTFDAGRLAWFDSKGAATIITKVRPAIDTPRLSPDGSRIAFVNGSTGSGDLWVYDLARGALTVVPDTHESQHPLWTPDGTRIVFVTPVNGNTLVRSTAADQSSPPETIWTMPEPWSGYPCSFTPDGGTLLMTANPRGSDEKDLYACDLRTPELHRLFPKGPTRIWPRLSPDGALLAYTSWETGRFEVYLHRYPDLSSKTPVSLGGGGYRPTWSPDGRTLHYQYGNTIFGVDIESADPLRISRPRTIAHAPDLRFDVGRDGRILIPHPSGDWGVLDTIDVTIGWEKPLEASAARR